MKTSIRLAIKWHKNDNGGDRRVVTIDHSTASDLLIKKTRILNDFRTKPMDIDPYGKGIIGKIPYSVKEI